MRRFFRSVARRVAYRSESQNEASTPQALAYLTQEMTPYLECWGFTCRLLENPKVARLPLLVAERIEDPALPTVLTYGHGDTVLAMTDHWRQGFAPGSSKTKVNAGTVAALLTTRDSTPSTLRPRPVLKERGTGL